MIISLQVQGEAVRLGQAVADIVGHSNTVFGPDVTVGFPEHIVHLHLG